MGLAKTVRRRIESLGLPKRPEVRRPLEYHGSRRGGWTLCAADLSPRSIVYSAGLGRDISFDQSIIERHGVTVYGFDPTPAALEWLREQRLPAGFRLVPTGLAGCDGTAYFHPSARAREVSHTLLDRPETADRAVEVPVRRLSALMGELEHTRIDLLKLDIEGAEYAVIEDLLRERLNVAQILIEFHHRFPGVGRGRTHDAVRRLRAAGYRILHVAPSGREYAFLRA